MYSIITHLYREYRSIDSIYSPYIYTCFIAVILVLLVLLLLVRYISKNYKMSKSNPDRLSVIVHDTKKGNVCLKNLPADEKIPFYGIVGTVASVRKISDQDLYVECKSKVQQQKLLSITDLAGISVECYIPYPITDGVVQGISDPHKLRHHPDVVKYSFISEYLVRIIFAKPVLPRTITLDDKDYIVKPYSPRITRCTKCQTLNDLKECKAKYYTCSKCSKNHPRYQCREQSFSCANCSGKHSSAFHKCPKQIDLKNKYTQRSERFNLLDINLEAYSSVSSKCSDQETNDVTPQHPNVDLKSDEFKSVEKNELNLTPKKTLESKPTDQQSENTTYNTSSNNTAKESKNHDHRCCPSFIQFILSTVKPILALSQYASQINQLAKIYKSTYQIDSEEWKVSDSDKRDAEILLGITKKSSFSRSIACSSSDTTEETILSNDNGNASNKKSKQLDTLNRQEIHATTDNLIIGDSVIRNVTLDDDKTNTQVFSVAGLSLDDCKEWCNLNEPVSTVKNVIVHVGINSCKSKAIDTNTWLEFIDYLGKRFPNAQILLSSIIPARGSRKTLSEISISSMRSACELSKVGFIDHYNMFKPKGQYRKSLYRDEVHLNTKGSAFLSDRLFSFLRD